jgi:ABC-2 type transport system permease protein
MSFRRLTRISVMGTLVKREFQEQRALFVYLPVLLTLMIAVLFTLALVKSQQSNLLWSGFEGLLKHEGVPGGSAMTIEMFFALSPQLRAIFISNLLNGPLPLFWLCVWGVPFYYFSTSLYNQRKNRSILFWNSMPVSNSQTITAKFLAGMIGVPLVVLACVLALQAFMLLCLLIRGALYHVDLWQTFFIPPHHIFDSYVAFVWGRGISLLSAFPAYAWVLLASARFQSTPFVWAMCPWGLVTGIEYIFNKKIPLTNFVFNLATGRFFDGPSAQMNWESFPAMQLSLGIVAGLVLLYAAIRLNRSEDV